MRALMDAEQQRQAPRHSRASRVSGGAPAQPRVSVTDDAADGRRSSSGPQGTARVRPAAGPPHLRNILAADQAGAMCHYPVAFAVMTVVSLVSET